MALIEPLKHEVDNPAVSKKYASPLRLWHWLNLAIISGSLITVLINSTLLTRSMSPGVQAELQQNGTPISAAQAKTAVHYLGDKVWGIHIYFGYCLAALILLRIIAEFFQPAGQTFTKRFTKALTTYKNVLAERNNAKHEIVVKLIYMLFYLMILIMAVTGLSLAFEDQVAFLKPMHGTIKSIHGFTMYPIIAFIVIHIIGVVLAERKPEGKGIVSDMINGG